MTLRMNAILVGLSMMLTFAITGCGRTETATSSPMETGRANDALMVASRPANAAPEAPLLLLDEPEEDEATSEPMADNSRCFVCHVNYMNEEIAANHARRGIGCADCHGPSDAHIADESWGSGGNGTAPDVMYPRDRINPACMACHPQDKLSSQQHEPVFRASNPKVCTDCHGSHRLPVRRCKWR